jgi:hypothetical protein
MSAKIDCPRMVFATFGIKPVSRNLPLIRIVLPKKSIVHLDHPNPALDRLPPSNHF